MIYDTLHDIITSDATVQGITTRCHPSADPQKLPYPKITYEHVTTDTGIDNDGPHIQRYAFQVDCWATTYKGANALADAVVNALQLYEDETVKKIIVGDCFDNTPSLDQGKDKQTIHRKTIRLTVSV